MNNEQFRRHLTNVSIEDQNKQIIFEYDDKEKIIGNISYQKVKVDSDRIAWKEYLIISSIEQLEEHINDIPANKDNNITKIVISSCIFRDQNILDQVLEKYSDKDIRFVSCFFIFSEVMSFKLNNENSTVSFSNCYFKCQLDLLGAISRLEFILCDFLGVVRFLNIEFFSIMIESCIFNMGVVSTSKLQGFSKDSLLSFNNSIFKSIVKMQYANHEFSIYFENSKFLQESYFNEIIKLGKLVFKNIEFHRDVSFNNSKFENITLFNSVTFKSNADLSYAEFFNIVDFFRSEFQKIVTGGTKFHKDSIFDGATFDNLVDLKYTTFKENASFRATKFNRGLNLARVNINNSAILDFHDAKINNENSYQISLKDKQETYRILKHESLKKNDTIKAVEFYKDECESHYQTLKWHSRDFFDKFILAFEKYVSNYGISIFRSIVSLVLINIMFVVLTLLKLYLFTTCLFLLSIFFIGYLSSFDKHSSVLNKIVYFTLSIMMGYVILKLSIFIYQILNYITLKSTRFLSIEGSKGVSLATLIHIAINATLVYEIIKSFRKYSRKL
ncbi:pentapeptide repeat-containing protein [Francisella tularensis subsp. novicida FSC159]|uniref:pentapeptide repeat-containing protein n=1 Tax=Francisella tularensis TaxID=263 RepID=UPI001C0EF521|nr:pentapeptide repeat-containing protein [Francisella tularensis]MBK2111657.1 pentapeptide repeat-containing protein [Francisella tularensis subsp. novicida FSC159]